MPEIAAVPMVQIVAGRDGRQFEVSEGAGDIARQLREIDPSLRVSFNEAGFFAVGQLLNAAREAVPTEAEAASTELVMRVPMDEWDGRVVKEFERRAYEVRHGIPATDRLDELDAKRAADVDYQADQAARTLAGPLRHATLRAQGHRPMIHLPRGVK